MKGETRMNSTSTQERILVVRPTAEMIPSFHETLGLVARERVYIEMIDAPPFDSTMKFQSQLIDTGAPVAYALSNAEVVGWADISPLENPRMSHRGMLGMGIKAGFRGQGLGGRLLGYVLEQAKNFGLEKVGLMVYATNKPAIALYEKFGFEPEGYLKNYRKLDGRYFDCIMMAKFF
jgi:RimJ/RimL family protein N-acetyltransferase